MLGKFERCECELEPFVRVDGAFERAESWPSRTSRGSPSTPAPGVRCKGAGRPLSNRLPGTLLREMGDGKVKWLTSDAFTQLCIDDDWRQEEKEAGKEGWQVSKR